MTTSATSGIKIEQQPNVNITRPDPDLGEGATEETMEQYAARREAEMRGEKPPEVEKPAAPAKDEKPAAATDDKPAAATDDAKPGETKPTDPATEDDPEKLIEETHPAKKGVSKRFSELTAQRKEAEAAAEKARQEAAEARAENERLAAELEAAKATTPAVPKAEEDPAPSRDAFEDPDEYQAALTAHAARVEIRKANERAEAATKERQDKAAAEAETKRQARVAEQITALHKTFNERVEKTKADYPDYDAKVTNNEALIVRNDIFFTIEQAELAPHILYHLAANPDEVESLNKMPPIQAAMRIGEIQTEIRIARKPKPSKAADPIKPVGHRSSPDRKTPDEMSMEEYAKMREQQEAEARAAKRRAH